jgi:hypothetical protein
MLHYKKIAVVTVLSAVTAIGIFAMRPVDDKPPKRNLKVLPKDISHDQLGKTMDSWKTALGVKCNFCHAPSADTSNHHLDFASDAKMEKLVARKMFKMCARINKKFFGENKDSSGVLVPTISCITCHRGSPHPDEVK